jgi:hypothetical protein
MLGAKFLENLAKELQESAGGEEEEEEVLHGNQGATPQRTAG